MRIETERLNIEIATIDEMEGYIAEQTDGELLKAYREMLQGAKDNPEDYIWYAIWFIRLKNGKIVGDLSFKGLNSDGKVEIGYGVIEKERDKGYATEAVKAATEWALNQPKVKAVEAETEPNNEKSQRVLKKCGFVFSGDFGEEGPRFFKMR